MVEVLLKAGADVHKPDGGKWRRTTIHYAATKGASDVVEILCTRGASVQSQNALGELSFTMLLRETIQKP